MYLLPEVPFDGRGWSETMAFLPFQFKILCVFCDPNKPKSKTTNPYSKKSEIPYSHLICEIHHLRKPKRLNVYLHVETTMTKNSGTPLAPGNTRRD